MSQRWIDLLQRRRTEYRGTGRLLNIAHRGARAAAPENTVEAIEQAARRGADMVEIDVHLSRDGELVVTHDSPGSLTLGELRTKHPRMPTLSECLACARRLSLLVNVEIKNLPAAYPDIEQAVLAAIARADAIRHVLVSSFDHESLALVRQLDPAIATAVLTHERLYQPADYLTRLDADALHPGGYVPARNTVAALRSRRRGVNVWTENDPERMRTLIAAGVTGIITDYPDRLREVLDSLP
jgi:glycerophosphoryl diester phosphodiesterase